VNLRIEKQNKVMALQTKLIMATSSESAGEIEHLRRELNLLQAAS
jgi:hypothetical protein